MGQSGLRGLCVGMAMWPEPYMLGRPPAVCSLPPVPAGLTTTPKGQGRGIDRGWWVYWVGAECLWSFPKMERETGVGGAEPGAAALGGGTSPAPADRVLAPLHHLEADSLCPICRGTPRAAPPLLHPSWDVLCCQGGDGRPRGALGAEPPLRGLPVPLCTCHEAFLPPVQPATRRALELR